MGANVDEDNAIGLDDEDDAEFVREAERRTTFFFTTRLTYRLFHGPIRQRTGED